MSDSSFPVVDCLSCSRTCGSKVNAGFIRSWLFAWAKGQPLPECGDYREKYFRGQELARW